MLLKKAKTVRQSRPLSSTAFNIKWSSNFEYLRLFALRLLGWSISRHFLFPVDVCGASENVAAPEALAQVLVLGLELLVVTGISISPTPNAALRKMLSEKSPIVASMTEKPQILGLYVSKKTTFPFAFDAVYHFIACFVFLLFFVRI